MWALPSTSTSGLEEAHTRASLLPISQVLGCKPQPPIENAHLVAPKYTGAPIGYAGRGTLGRGKRAHAPSHKKPKGQYDMVSTNRKSPRGRRWETQYIKGHFILKLGNILHLRNMISRRRSTIHYFHDDKVMVGTLHMRSFLMTPRIVFRCNPVHWRMHQTHCPSVNSPNRSSHSREDKGLNQHPYLLGKKPFNYGICQVKHDANIWKHKWAYMHAQTKFRWNDFDTKEQMRSNIVNSNKAFDMKATDQSEKSAMGRSSDRPHGANKAMRRSSNERCEQKHNVYHVVQIKYDLTSHTMHYVSGNCNIVNSNKALDMKVTDQSEKTCHGKIGRSTPWRL